MTNKTFYNEILIDHNMHPGHKHDLDDANMVIVDGSFVGEGCAVSQASADMMLDLIIGQKVEDAEKLADNFLKMIKGTATEEEIESLEEASALEDIAHMPARVKCAVLGWHTMEEMLKCDKCSGHGECSHCDTEG